MTEEVTKEIQKDSRQDLYEFEISRFEELLEKDRPYAFQRYGWSLIYSMEPERSFQLLQDLGWKGKDVLDFYNQGTLYCEEENYKEAMKQFEKAESMGCERPELFYNMAVIFEIQEDKPKAKQYYQRYIDKSEHWDDIPKSLQVELDEVREHLKTL